MVILAQHVYFDSILGCAVLPIIGQDAVGSSDQVGGVGVDVGIWCASIVLGCGCVDGWHPSHTLMAHGTCGQMCGCLGC